METKVTFSVLFFVSLGFVICSASRVHFTHEDRNVLAGYGGVVHRALNSGPSFPGFHHYKPGVGGDVPVAGGSGLGREEADAAGYVGGPSGRGVDRESVNGVGGGGSGESPGGVPGVEGVGQRSGEGGGANGGGHREGSGARKGGTHGGYAP